MSLPTEHVQTIIEAALMVAGRPLTINAMQALFNEDQQPSADEIKAALTTIRENISFRGIELKEIASGYRFQAKAELSPWLSKLWEERAPRYSRAFLETLAIIAYKQPITRAEIEEIRGVTVSSHIVKTLQEREWIRVLGFRDVPGKPAIYGTTKTFLDYFNVKSLADLPTLAEFKSMEAQEEQLQVQLALENSNIGPSDSEVIPEESNVIAINDSASSEELSEVINEELSEVINEEENEEELATG